MHRVKDAAAEFSSENLCHTRRGGVTVLWGWRIGAYGVCPVTSAGYDGQARRLKPGWVQSM